MRERARQRPGELLSLWGEISGLVEVRLIPYEFSHYLLNKILSAN